MSSGEATPCLSWGKVWRRILSSACFTCPMRWWSRTRTRQVSAMFMLLVWKKSVWDTSTKSLHLQQPDTSLHSIKKCWNVTATMFFLLCWFCIRTSYPSGLWGTRQPLRMLVLLSLVWPGSSHYGSTAIKRCGQSLVSHSLEVIISQAHINYIYMALQSSMFSCSLFSWTS